jgi:hypothetical protein
MKLIPLSISILLALSLTVSASVDDFTRAVSDPVDNLIYPQQIVAGSDGNIYILDTISTSSHIKTYSPSGDFISGIVPAGAGQDSAKFDLGLTLVSGKNIFAECGNSEICLMDNEDGWSVLKVYNFNGSLEKTLILGKPVGDAEYGAVCAEGDDIYFEYDDQIFLAKISNLSDAKRFTGKQGEVIKNWDASGGFVAVLVGEDIVVYNSTAMPVETYNISELLGIPISFDIFDLAINSKKDIAITGEIATDENNSKPFVAEIAPMAKQASVFYPDKYITSLDYSSSGTLMGIVFTGETLEVIKFSLDLREIPVFSARIHKPVLANPRQIAVSDENTIWLDDQYDKSDSLNPFGKDGDFSLFLKWFKGNESGKSEIRKLGENRFASFFLDNFDGSMILSGMVLDSDGQPIEMPVFSVDTTIRQNFNELKSSEESLIINNLAVGSSQNEVLALDPVSGEIHEMILIRDSLNLSVDSEGFKPKMEGIPFFCPLDDSQLLMQAMTSPESVFPPISLFDISRKAVSDVWKASEHVDMRLLYSCDDSTVVVYWFPKALLRIDDHFNILAYIDLMDESAYDFLDGANISDKHFLLDGRYNIVYGFDDSAWQVIEKYSYTDVKLSISFLRDQLAIFFSRENEYPDSLEDLIRYGLTDYTEMTEAFRRFLGDTPISYKGTKYGYVFLVWGKDPDNTIFEVTSKDIREY